MGGNMKNMRWSFVAAAALLASGFVSSASAQSTWNLSGACAPTGAAAFGNTASCSSGGVTATFSAWSTTRSGAANNVQGGTGFASAWLSPQGGSGAGIANRYEGFNVNAPDHAVDNVLNTTDAVVVGFSNSVALNQLRLGWWQTDSDLTVLRWTGAAAPQMASTDVVGANGLIAKGWELVGSYADVGNMANSTLSFNNSTTSAVSSSWWLISAYNASYGGGHLSVNNDYFKLLSLGGLQPPSRVPEPGSLGLAMAALFGLAYTRRRFAAR
jgi:hypothetical protein